MTSTTSKTRTIRTGGGKAKSTATAPKAVESPSKTEMAKEPRLVHTGTASSTYRLGKKLTPLRQDYRAGDMTAKDNEALRDLMKLADKDGAFTRRNLDAGRLGRLFTQGFIHYEEIGVVDPEQVITITDKAKAFVKPVKAA